MALILVLGAVSVTMILCLAFLSAQSTSLGVAQNVNRHARARATAESAMDLAIAHVRTNSNWRSDHNHGAWATNQLWADGSFDIFGYDGFDADNNGVIDATEGDGDLADDESDPLTLTVVGEYEGVTHTLRSVLEPPAPTSGLIVLMIVRDAGSLSHQETLKRTQIQAWGYTVHLLSDHASQSAYDLAIADADVVFVNEDALSYVIGDKLHDAPIGVVNEEGNFNDELDVAASYRWHVDRRIDIVDNSHYITEPFSAGRLQVLSSYGFMINHTGSLAPDAWTLAERPSSSREVLVTVDAGQRLLGSETAAGRRALLPWGASFFDFAQLNSDGLTIFQRALLWACNKEGGAGGGTPVILGYDQVFSEDGDDVERRQLATSVTLNDSIMITSISAYLSGDDDDDSKARLAIYADNAGEPGDLIVETDRLGLPEDEWEWVTGSVAPTALAAGDYWLALALNEDDSEYRYSSGGRMRRRSHNAVRHGFLADWGASTSSQNRQLSIYVRGVASGGGGGSGVYSVRWVENP